MHSIYIKYVSKVWILFSNQHLYLQCYDECIQIFFNHYDLYCCGIVFSKEVLSYTDYVFGIHIIYCIVYHYNIYWWDYDHFWRYLSSSYKTRQSITGSGLPLKAFAIIHYLELQGRWEEVCWENSSHLCEVHHPAVA